MAPLKISLINCVMFLPIYSRTYIELISFGIKGETIKELTSFNRDQMNFVCIGDYPDYLSTIIVLHKEIRINLSLCFKSGQPSIKNILWYCHHISATATSIKRGHIIEEVESYLLCYMSCRIFYQTHILHTSHWFD